LLFHVVPVFNSVALTSENLRTIVVCAKPPNVNVTNDGSQAMSSNPRHRRTPDQRRRGLGATGAGVAIAVGGAMAAAFVSMGTASADTGDDAVTALAQAVDTTALAAAAVPAQAGDAAVPAQALDAFETLVETIDPTAFNSTTGAPTDFIGDLASQIDSDVGSIDFGTDVEGTDVTLNTIAGQVSCLLDSTCTDVLSTVPTTDDDGFTVLTQFVEDTYISEIAPVDLTSTLDSDLTTIAGGLDSYFADTVFGPDIYNIAEYIISALTTTADPAAFVP
jgi:hypothetical protein